MESRFDYDFSQARIHTDVQAAESAWTVNTVAYTVKWDIVFAAKQKLLAHELMHVIQQASESQKSRCA